MKSKPAITLDDLLCLDLYTASRLLIRAYGPFLEKMGLTYPQYLVMKALWETDGLKVKDLAERLHLDSGTLSPLIKRLEGAGLVSRTRGKEDEREVQVDLTAAGRNLQKRADEITTEMICVSGLTKAEAEKLQLALRDVVRRIESGGHAGN